MNPQLASVEIRKIKELGLSTRRQEDESGKQKAQAEHKKAYKEI